MHQITPEQGDAITRARWPRPYTETLPIDYSLHTSECGSVGSEADEIRPAARCNGWIAVALVAALAAVVIALTRSPL
jgi:hypothetical protein